MTQLVANYVGEGSHIAFQVFQDIPGFDPQRMIGPDMELAKAIFATGWGLDAKGEALLLIARRPDGSLYWHSVLVTPQGFAPPIGQMSDGDALPNIALLDALVQSIQVGQP